MEMIGYPFKSLNVVLTFSPSWTKRHSFTMYFLLFNKFTTNIAEPSTGSIWCSNDSSSY